jgi:hypothetical protein
MIADLQRLVAGTRIRFVISFLVLCVVFGFSFLAWLRFCEAMRWAFLPRFIGFGVLAVILAAFYALRCRQLRISPLWALAALIPIGNIAVPIVLIVMDEPRKITTD